MSSSVETKLEKSIFLRVIAWGLKFENGFTYKQITQEIKLAEWELKIIDQYLYYAHLNHVHARKLNQNANIETPFWMIQGGSSHQDDSCKYIIGYDAQFKYIDYQELKIRTRKRKRSKETFNLGYTHFHWRNYRIDNRASAGGILPYADSEDERETATTNHNFHRKSKPDKRVARLKKPSRCHLDGFSGGGNEILPSENIAQQISTREDIQQ